MWPSRMLAATVDLSPSSALQCQVGHIESALDHSSMLHETKLPHNPATETPLKAITTAFCWARHRQLAQLHPCADHICWHSVWQAVYLISFVIIKM